MAFYDIPLSFWYFHQRSVGILVLCLCPVWKPSEGCTRFSMDVCCVCVCVWTSQAVRMMYGMYVIGRCEKSKESKCRYMMYVCMSSFLCMHVV